VTAIEGTSSSRRASARTLRSIRSVPLTGAIVAVVAAAAVHLGAPAPADASAVCPPPGTLAQIISVDATDPGPLTEQFRPIYGVYAESATACWPGTQIVLTGHVSSPEGLGGVSAFTIEPAWLVSRAHWLSVTDAVDPDIGPVGPFLPVAVPDNLEAAFTSLAGRWVQVSGHFDDEVAQTCVVTEGVAETGEVPTAEQGVDICRSSFVVTSVEPLSVPNTDTTSSIAAPGIPIAWQALAMAIASFLAFGLFVRRIPSR
jgi:hypothetical protein